MAVVLVVDDSPLDRRLAQALLQRNRDFSIVVAGNGVEALEILHRLRPDIIVTDLQMPDMDGLELVGQVRSDFPLVPVILMTAHGSEEVAVQALKRGAASYVPKTRLARDLQDTVDNVLAMARADRCQLRLLQCLTHTVLRFELENDPSLVYPLVDHLQQHVSRLRLVDDTGRIRVGVALEEALLNALYHGNLELTGSELNEIRNANPPAPNLFDQRRASAPYRDRKIILEADLSAELASFVIRDEGPGFDPGQVPDPTLLENLERECGRGLLLMRTFMDETRFNARGNEVTMIKRHERKQ
jgi:CheY-like chemotaxis protein